LDLVAVSTHQCRMKIGDVRSLQVEISTMELAASPHDVSLTHVNPFSGFRVQYSGFRAPGFLCVRKIVCVCVCVCVRCVRRRIEKKVVATKGHNLISDLISTSFVRLLLSNTAELLFRVERKHAV
jgi:hypothetical protein